MRPASPARRQSERRSASASPAPLPGRTSRSPGGRSRRAPLRPGRGLGAAERGGRPRPLDDALAGAGRGRLRRARRRCGLSRSTRPPRCGRRRRRTVARLLDLMERAGTAVAEAVAAPLSRRAQHLGLVRYRGERRRRLRRCAQAARSEAEVSKSCSAGRRTRSPAMRPRTSLARANLKIPSRTRQAARSSVDALFGTGFAGKPRDDGGAADRGAERASASRSSPSTSRAGSTPRRARSAAPPCRPTRRSPSTRGRSVWSSAPGRFHAGEVEVADIGLAPVQTRHGRVTEEILELVPRRGAE